MKLLALVVGAGGQLGEAMVSQLAVRHEVVGLTRAELDATSIDAVREAVQGVCPDVIINCSAYTNVDAAEREPAQALAVNAMAVRALAQAAAELDAIFVHYSTDFVFDGRTDRPYAEDDAPNPRGTYALTKLLGEWLAADVPRHYILRVESLFGGANGRSSIDRILDQILGGTEVRAFADRTVSPSYVDDVVSATSQLLALKSAPGLYHCVNTGWTTWAELARELARLVGRPDAPIAAVPVASVNLAVDRPKFAALSNQKLAAAGIAMPPWQDAIARYVAERARKVEP
jgi:dTDP-4-dehydrorhamnose reductase